MGLGVVVVEEDGVVRPSGAGLEQAARVAAGAAEVRLLDEQDPFPGCRERLAGSGMGGEGAALVDQDHAPSDARERRRGEAGELGEGVVLGAEGRDDDGQRPDRRVAVDGPLGGVEPAVARARGELEPAPVDVGRRDVERPRRAVGQLGARQLTPLAAVGGVGHETSPSLDGEPHRASPQARPPADGRRVVPRPEIESVATCDGEPALARGELRRTAPEQGKAGDVVVGAGEGEALQRKR
ncbi:hypothetical protein GCM10025864_28490 [Luteimicrobium album]|uniref:Uncharacterized protein n=1 Tax=Luteimicrobium album TaxID=1054550 RepID=A0ABQ6I2U6_9MICO|nr:hypothetical protein [Luteimicrobium album]GMA25090.1 hypothetical protein GCM10025864_28490 [Luteimicrobium album]